MRARYARLTSEGVLQVVAVTNPLGLGFDQALVGVKTVRAARRGRGRDLALARGGLRRRHRGPVRPRRRGRRLGPARDARADEPDARARRESCRPRPSSISRCGNSSTTGGHAREHADDEHEHEGAAAGRARPPLAPLHAHGRPRAADHRARRGLLPRGQRGQALPRRARRALRRAGRLLVRRGDGPGRARADARAAVLHELVVRAPARDRARAGGRVARAGRPEPRASSSPAAPRRSSPRGSSRGSTTRRAASAAGRPSRAAPRTTARRWARSRSTASPRCARRSSRSCPDTIHVRNTNRYHRPPDETEEEFTAFLLEDLDSAIVQAGPETVAMVIMEPVQNAGGSFTPPQGYWHGVREICDRYGILLCADEVITGFGRVGEWFGSEQLRHQARPDHVGEGPLVGVCVDRRRDRGRPRRRAVHERVGDVRARHHVRRPSGAVRDRAEEHRDHEARADRRERARQRRHVPRDARAAARPADRRRHPRHGLLLRDRARQGQGDA